MLKNLITLFSIAVSFVFLCWFWLTLDIHLFSGSHSPSQLCCRNGFTKWKEILCPTKTTSSAASTSGRKILIALDKLWGYERMPFHLSLSCPAIWPRYVLSWLMHIILKLLLNLAFASTQSQPLQARAILSLLTAQGVGWLIPPPHIPSVLRYVQTFILFLSNPFHWGIIWYDTSCMAYESIIQEELNKSINN